jgi:signal transduction histidine kinase/ligand-binding sensor domain-containing protein
MERKINFEYFFQSNLMKIRFFLVFILTFLNLTLFADESGRYFMNFFTPEQTVGHFQNWTIIQDDRGVMYIGNGYGILEYDGSKWRLIPNTNKSFATSFAKDSTGRIYVGCAAEFGYLEPDSKGDMQFISLLEQVPGADRGFTSVNKVIALKEGILFQARERIFLFTPVPAAKGEKESWNVKIWRPENGNIPLSDYADNTLYALDSQKGLMKLVDDVYQPVPEGEKMLQTRARLLTPFPGHSGEYLVYRVKEGFFLYDGKTFKPWKTEADAQIIGTYTDMKFLRDGNIAVSSIVNGLFILDQAGRLKLHLSTANGLLSNVIKKIFIDLQGNLWLAMDGGVGMIEYNSNTRHFQMEGAGTTDIIRFRGKIYAATLTGIYYLDPKDAEFRIVNGIPKGFFSFLTLTGGQLISASLDGIFEVRESRAKILFTDSIRKYGFSYIHPISSDSARFLCGSITGLYLLKQDPKSRLMTIEKKFQDIFEYIFTIRESEPGVFWIGTYDAGVIQLTFINNDLNHPVIEKYGPEQGLSSGTVMVNIVNGKLVFSTNKGFYKYIPATNRFEPDPFYKEMKLGINPSEYPSVSDKKGNIWADGGKDLAFYRRLPNGNFRMEKGSFSRFFGHMVNCIYPENDSTTWLGLSGSVVRINTSAGVISTKPWSSIIRSVRITGDIPLYMGSGKSPGLQRDATEISYKTNDIAFEYSGLSYIMPEYNEFSIRLDGYDRNWSGWMKDTKFNYTNLPSGNYVFRVKCRNIIGQDGSEATYAFTITTPWYQTLWAYLAYIIMAASAVYALLLVRTRQLRQRSRELEKIVEQRTAQIQEQKDNIEQLSKIGKDITSSLSIENIIHTVYENVNNLMDASVFTIGLHKPEEECLEFPASIEKGVLLSAFSIPLSDEYRLAVWCFINRKEVIINDYEKDYDKYVGQMAAPIAGETPESVLYLPLWNKDKVIGVISAQSFSKNAFSDYHLNMLRNLATYSAIALENADAYRHLAILLDELRAAQDRLVTQSKLAALGELTAGISHEIQNPLNFVNNFSEICNELLDEVKEELVKGNQEEVNSLFHNLKLNLEKINYHGKRADSIVKSMLQHSLGSTGQKQPTDINNLTDEFFRLAYHGLRAKDKSFQASMKSDFDPDMGKINVVSQDIGRVVLNLISNAFYAVTERKKLNQPDYEPTVWVSTKKVNGKIQIRVKDNGIGIPQKILDKIFQPFFTTKPTGEGTGLGLSLAYDIVTKGHGGELKVETREGEGSEFIVLLPAENK